MLKKNCIFVNITKIENYNIVGKIEKDLKVYLEPIEHVYIHKESGKKYKSVTTVISLIEEEFKSEEVALAIENQFDGDKQEQYLDMTKDQILDYWQEINDEANEYGTYVHELIEEYLLKNKWFFPKDEFDKKVIREFNKVNFELGRECYPERIMFSEEYELAGTADLIVDIDDIYFDLGDWKTNSKFNYYSPYGQTLKAPFEHLQDCQYVVYTLQLSTYVLMYEMETGKKCRHIWIGHWDKEKEVWSKIPVMYMKHEALKLMKHWKMISLAV